MIDSDGYRPNVGIIVANNAGQVLWTKRIGRSGWQFPQGGIDTGEKVEDALYRELEEEIGLRAEHVKIIRRTDGWLRYKLPKQYLRQKSTDFVGQKQKWFLLKMLAEDHCVRFDRSATPEFESWQWVSYWYPLSQVVTFKKDVYLRAMKALASGIASCITPP